MKNTKTQPGNKFQQNLSKLFENLQYLEARMINSCYIVQAIKLQELLSTIKYFAQLFQSKQQLIYDIADALQYKFVHQNEIIFKQGDQGDMFYIVLQGTVSIQINIPQEDVFVPKEVATITEGGSFGELALQSSQARTATSISVTDCHFATIDKTTYKQLIGDYNKNQLDQKIAFLSKYPWFQQWSLREMKMLAYELNEKLYDYGDKIILKNHIGMINNGQVELKRVIEKRGIQDHPMKISKLMKHQLSVEILDEQKIIGELNFLDEEGNLKFMINKYNKPYVKSAAEPETKEFIQASQKNKGIYEAVCYSNHVSIYFLKVSTIEDRFYDQLTRQLFQIEIKKLLNVRIKKAHNLQQEYDKQFQESLEEQQVKMRISGFQSRKITPVKIGTIIRSQNNEEWVQDSQYQKKFEKNLPHGVQYRYSRIYDLEEKSQYIKVLEDRYNKLKTEENEAQDNLRMTFTQMNCSYYRLKSHFERQKFNKLFFQAYLKKKNEQK
ncbi:unnamed protein product (macronuclear) [Paramecium tetraurelia]|uniref:Cyclic nucleotide-binding domain-containing protein n=1 Tax=Paramecium tetraurelia TaxID=5888 RepID=A0DBC7_PARTE|nr:uncharacterized protein GSPATT00015238001 [Paramecium tetraurelia]CAK80344.1 unnamed protein product [Paramecium tetraurelia]|eukprot:XP_001447741.1 hypothetical protein (macronuclear) [Paramecium tetraurelia strain d4-2]